MSQTTHTCATCDRTTRNVLCERCIHILELRLADIPALVDELELTISRQGRGGGSSGHRKKGDDQPLPYNAAASGKREVLAVLVEWADHIAPRGERPMGPVHLQCGHRSCHEIRWNPPTPLSETAAGRSQQATDAVCRLLANLTWFRVSPDAPSAADAIWSIRNQLRAAIDRPPERLWAGPCNATLPISVAEHEGAVTVQQTETTCERQLYREWGKDTVTCDGWIPPSLRRGQPPTPGCGAEHTLDGRHEFLLADIEERLLPLRVVIESLYELMPGCDIRWETARKWPRRQRIPRVDAKGRTHITVVPPRLVAHSVTPLGVELFRGGDIIALARDEAPRRGRRRKVTRHNRSA